MSLPTKTIYRSNGPYWLSRMLRCKAWSIALCGCDHTPGKCCEKLAWLCVRLDPWLARRRGSSVIFFTSNQTNGTISSCTSVPNSYSQYFSTQWSIVYYTWFTASALAVKSVFWHTHVIHVSLNTELTLKLFFQKNSFSFSFLWNFFFFFYLKKNNEDWWSLVPKIGRKIGKTFLCFLGSLLFPLHKVCGECTLLVTTPQQVRCDSVLPDRKSPRSVCSLLVSVVL